VLARFFHDSYKKRDSPELLIDAALGRIELDESAPAKEGGDDDVRIRVAVHGGRGTIRQGIKRQLVVRFSLREGLHLYAEPVPEGMLPTTVEVGGPDGLVLEEAILPPSSDLRVEGADSTLHVFSGQFDIVIPFYASGELASEVRPLDVESVEIEVSVRYQACDEHRCLLPQTRRFALELPLDVIDVPALSMHMGHGQREASFDAWPHMRRLILRKLRRHPLGLPRLVVKTIGLELAARRRAWAGRRQRKEQGKQDA